MPEPDLNLEELLQRYRLLPESLEQALAGLSDAQLDLARAPDAWSIRQIVHHLVDADDVTQAMVKAAAGTPGCLYSMEWYDPHNTWDVTLRYDLRPVPPALELLRANHHEMEWLLGSLPDVWDRSLMLRRRGAAEPVKLTVARLLWNQTAHAYHHVGQIAETRRLRGA